MSKDQEFETSLARLSEEFVANLPELLGALETEWARLWHEGWDSPAHLSLMHQLHTLNGAAASLGFEQIASHSRELNHLLNNKGNSHPKTVEQILAEADARMGSLRRAVYTHQQISLADLTRRIVSAKETSSSLHEKRADRLIYMVEDDPIQAAELAEQVGYFGYSVQTFQNPAELEEAIHRAVPTALLMDVSFPEGVMWGYESISALRSKFQKLPPIIFVTINDQMSFRLQAVRVGGEAYFTKPVDIGALIDVLDRLILQDIFPPSRVLVVDDSRVQANYIAMQLSKVGITTEIVSDPLKLVDHMIGFNPDLLLLDMYMPGSTGMELAKIIRQMEQFISVPIVFLSAETDKDKQLAAMGIGGDDFLTKPIEPEHLISAVTTRIERYRRLRALMIQDGLTGLLNHRTIKERLAQEIERARRHNLQLSFAMIDLDHFKVVNDTHGHAIGDRVLKSLAHMLKQRLRSTDTIGRYGGEEFAIIFADTDEEMAAKVMSELCAGFGKIHHYSGDQEFSVTFSGGVASYPDCDGVDELIKAADRALYAAKTAGRNQVMRINDIQSVVHRSSPAALNKEFKSTGITDEAAYRKLVSDISLAIVRFDKGSVITYANAFAQRSFGYTEAEMVGQPVVGTLFAPTDARRAELQAMLANILRSPERYTQVESENTCKGGEKIWMSWRYIPLVDETGRLSEILCLGNDITAGKRAEMDLARTVAYLSTLSRISQVVVDKQDLSNMIAQVSREVVDLFESQHVGVSLLTEDRNTLEFIGDSQDGWDESPGAANRIDLHDDPASNEAIQTGKAVYVTDAMTNPLTQGSHALLEVHGIKTRIVVPLISRGITIGTMNIDFEKSGRQVSATDLELAEIIAGSIASVIESSQLFRAEQQQREYLEALLGNIPVAVVTIDSQAMIRSWNPAAESLFGYTDKEAIGQPVDDLLSSEEYRQEATGFTQDIFHEGKLVHSITRRRRKDGTLADVELFAVPVFHGQVQSSSLAIYHDITDLQHARRAAETANEAKSAFLATMSHEIRTPLNAVVGMTTLLLDTELTNEQREFSETIRTSSDALLTIINDILDFSKIEAGRMELEEQTFDLRECVESALDLVAPQATEKGIDLAYIIDPGVPSVIIGDATRLRQILLNLLSNALKFTSAGEVVLSVSAERTSQAGSKAYRLHFSVRDTGIGIPPERRDLLFQSFSQLDASTTRKYGGTGLGLAISKRLAELMGGSMWVESEGIQGKGSTFHFTICADHSTSPVPIFLHAKQPALSGKRALIVDDNATNRYILIRQVKSWGMLPQDTPEPRQALQWIQEGQNFDIALLDMQMPDMDGLTLAAEIARCRQNLPDLPVVILTSLGMKEVDTKDAKIASYLTKPIKPVVLYSTLLKAFGGQPAQIKHRPEPTPVESSPNQLAPLRILLAEDSLVNQKVALHLLERIGYKADVAGNGLEVLQAMQRQPYDVILMDVQMPEMDGLEATRQVRSGEWLGLDECEALEHQPAIIAMTANAMQGDREVCLAAGMDDYISKPIRLEELARALGSVSLSTQPVKMPATDSTEAPTDEGSSEVIDEATFRKFHLTFGEQNPGAIASLIQDYLGETLHGLEDLHEAVDCNDAERIRRGSHSLKSSSMLFGASHLANLCKALEIDSAKHDLAWRTDMLAQIEVEFEAVKRALLLKTSGFDN